MTEPRPHRWKFMRAGGVDQVVIASGADVVNLEHLDQKLWVALACPTRGVELDPRTLDLIDTDNDGRIRPPELIAASRWVREHFADPDLLMQGGDSVALAAINDHTDAGRQLRAEAQALLALVGKPEAQTITLRDLDRRVEVLSNMGLNGDGVMPDAATADPELAVLIQTIIDTVGGVFDRNGKSGVDAAHADRFFGEARALSDWRRQPAANAALLPLGDASHAAAEALAAVRSKVDDYFVRCQLSSYDDTAITALNPQPETYRALGQTLLDSDTAALAGLPLAGAAAGRSLPLSAGLNPAWAERMARFRQAVVQPLLGAPLDTLSVADWQQIKDRMAACSAWLAAQPMTKIDALPQAALHAALADDKAARLAALIERDQQAGPGNERILALEMLLRFQRDLVHLLNNFVSFSEFYSRKGAIFEAGKLYLDARSCELAVMVTDAKRHATLAGMAKAYLAYCDCTRQGQKMGIVAAFTAGDVDFLFVGRNGVFYDRNGADWDATITKVIESPTSIGQAFLSPYKKFVRLIEETAAKRAAASDQRSQTLLTDVATRAVNLDRAAKPAAAAAAPAAATAASVGSRRIDVGTVAALGVALGSIGTVIVGVFTKFVDLGWWIPVGILGLVLAISGPSMLIAWLKLRQRSLGPILDASGWAINGRMRVNVPLGATLTKVARVPEGSEHRLHDAYAQPHGGRLWLLLGLLVVALALLWWRMGWLAGWLGRGAGAGSA